MSKKKFIEVTEVRGGKEYPHLVARDFINGVSPYYGDKRFSVIVVGKEAWIIKGTYEEIKSQIVGEEA